MHTINKVHHLNLFVKVSVSYCLFMFEEVKYSKDESVFENLLSAHSFGASELNLLLCDTG